VLLPGYRATGEEAEKVADDLLHQLEVYRLFKKVAQQLGERTQRGLRAYVRISPPLTAPAWFDLASVTLESLLAAAQEAMDMLPASPVEEMIPVVMVTVADQIDCIRELLVQKRRVRFQEVLSGAVDRVEVIVTLLAVLELLKQDHVRVWQEGLFGPIFIERQEPEPVPAAVPAPAPT
jgi:segregation and condensation protein A